MKQILRHIKKYFTIWWFPITGNFLAIGIFLLGTLFERDWIIDLSLFVLFTNILGTIISSIVQVVKRKWYFIFPQLGIAAFLFYYTIIIFTYSPPDYYGTHKIIPKNIVFSRPLDSIPTQQDYETDDLVLTNYVQPGIYKYYTDYQPAKIGFLYIKAFEITSNDRLSGESMKERSKIRIEKLESRIFEGEFTIYEGSWGDKYGSRIELWFQPLDGQEEYKITERNYIVEGWMR